MATKKQSIDQADDLMGRVIVILDQARANVVRAVNSNMVIAYWLVGREIVLDMQQGEERAGYRETLLRNLSEGLTARYGKGFSNSNLKYFRQFYRVYADRVPAIGHTACGQLAGKACKSELARECGLIEARKRARKEEQE